MEEDGNLVPLSACDQATLLRGIGGAAGSGPKKTPGRVCDGGGAVITDPQDECVCGRGKGRMALTDLTTRCQAAFPPTYGVEQPQSRHQVLGP